MSDLLKFFELNWHSGALFIAALLVVSVFLLQKTDWIVEKFGLKSKRQLAEEKQDEEINDLKTHAKNTDENFKKIIATVESTQQMVETLSKRVEDMQEKFDTGEAARLRDRISQAYHVYKSRGQITEIEKEAILGLIDEYKKYYSTNTFVNDKVYPFIMILKVIEE